MRNKSPPQVVARLKVGLELLHHHTRLEQLPELTVVQINILNLLDRERPTRPSVVASLRGVSRSAVSHALRRLEDADLIKRKRHPKDGRIVHIFLTAAGEQFKMWPSQVDEARVEELADNLSLVQHQGLQTWIDIGGKAAAGCDYRKNGRPGPKGLFSGPGVWPEEGPNRRPPFSEKRPRAAVRIGPRPGPKPKKKAEGTPNREEAVTPAPPIGQTFG